MKKIFLLIFLIVIIIYCLFSNNFENFKNYKEITITPTIPIYNKKIIAYYNFCTIFTNIYPLHHIEGTGSYNNIQKLLLGKIDFTLAQGNIVLDAVLGRGKFKNPNKNIRIITPLFEEKMCLIFNPNSKIKTWKDLKGKNVCFGNKGSGTLYIALELLKLIDINSNDLSIVYESINSENIINKLLNNELDAVCTITSHPNRKLKKLFNIKLLSMIGTKGIPNTVIKARFPTLNNSFIDLNDYNLPNLSNRIETISLKSLLITSSTQNFETVYKLINAIFSNTLYIRNNIKYIENKKVLEEFPVSGYFPKNNVIKLHNAVIKYYKDIGMITNNSNKKCILFAGTGECNLDIINYYTGY